MNIVDNIRKAEAKADYQFNYIHFLPLFKF